MRLIKHVALILGLVGVALATPQRAVAEKEGPCFVFGMTYNWDTSSCYVHGCYYGGVCCGRCIEQGW